MTSDGTDSVVLVRRSPSPSAVMVEYRRSSANIDTAGLFATFTYHSSSTSPHPPPPSALLSSSPPAIADAPASYSRGSWAGGNGSPSPRTNPSQAQVGSSSYVIS